MYEVRYVCLLQFVLSLVKFGISCLFLSAALKILLLAPFQQNLLPFVKTQNSTLLAKIQKWRLLCQNAICTFFLLVKTPKSSPTCKITKSQCVWVSQNSWNRHCIKFNISSALMQEVSILLSIIASPCPRINSSFTVTAWRQLGINLF